MNLQNKKLHPFGIFRSLILLSIFLVSFYSPAFSAESWIVNVTPGEVLNINPMNTQWLEIDGNLNAITLLDGKICVFEKMGEEKNWIETQRFGPDDIKFTIFQIKDINGDGLAEIITGTAEPGFIYIYKYNDGKWDVFNYGKYVWTSITSIAVGKFLGEAENGIIVQNQEGSLYLLKITDNSLDLVWKSPTACRPISSCYVIDIDNDFKDEIMVVYKSGGVGIFKIINNAVVSVWENYLWGKVLTVTSGDWDHDNQPELIIASSQKVIYFLGWTPEKGYQFEYQWSQLNYTIEKMVFHFNEGINQLMASDTAGRFHFFEYDLAKKEWVEDYSVSTGRITQIINADPKYILLWGFNRKINVIDAYYAKELKLNYLEQLYEIQPAVSVANNFIYIAPKAIAKIPELTFQFKTEKNNYTILYGGKTVEIKIKDLTVKLNKEPIVLQEPPILVNNELLLTIDTYQKLLNLNLVLNFGDKTIRLAGNPPLTTTDPSTESNPNL